MTLRASYFGTTTSHAVSDTPADFDVTGANESRHTYIVQSDVVVNIDRYGTANPASSLRIPADTLIKITTVAGDVVSYCIGTGEDDGTIWFTETDS
jgi:hypothetical protein